MRAAVAERPDGPDALVVRDVPRPEPSPGWALVRVEAFGLNRSEYMTLRGWSGDAVQFPRILGIECTGVVEAVAAGSAVAPGTTVAAVMGGMGRSFDGGYAEYALLPESQLMALETEPAVGRPRRAARDVHHRGRIARDARARARGDAARARRHVVGGPRVPRARARRGRADRGDDAQRGQGARAARARSRRGRRSEGAGFAERARAELPGRRFDGVVDLIGGRAVLDSLRSCAAAAPCATRACSAASG